MAEASEAEQFFDSLASDFDITSPLRWSFLLDGLSVDQVEPLMSEVSSLGFTEVEPLGVESEEDQFILGFAEIRVHTARSFVERLEAVNKLAAREGVMLVDYSAGLPEDASEGDAGEDEKDA